MKSESENSSPSAISRSKRYVKGNDLAELLAAQRLASTELYESLRIHLAEPEDLLPYHLLAENRRSRSQFEKAFELYRQADAKIDLLVSRFKGRS
jgi:hypothetical protein